MLEKHQKLAVYMEDAVRGDSGKMGLGVLRYSPNPIACVIDSRTAGEDIVSISGIQRPCPIVATVDEAKALGAEVFVLGIAPPGGLIPADWFPRIDRAWELGMSLVNGLHDLLGSRYPAKGDQWVWDIRIEPENLGVGTAAVAELKNQRVLLIGTDMAIGKMTAGLEVYKEALTRGIRTEFVATGQIGITVTGKGVPLDAIRVDYASGAIQREVLAAKEAELIIIEGQGSLLHPGSTATLPLVRGSCPTDFILCHRAGQTNLSRLPFVRIPPLKQFIKLYEDLASAFGNFPTPRTVAVALNTFTFSHAEAQEECDALAQELGIPVVDPVRHGAGVLVDALLANKK